MSAPNGKNAKISYFQGKAPIWVSNHEALNVPAALASDLQTKATAARAAFDAQQSAKAAWLTALGDCDIAVREMAQVGGSIIGMIRNTAKVEGDGIYTLAGLPIPTPPGPMPAPGQPTGFKVSLDGNGALTITWKADNPTGSQGTIYRIFRTIAGGEQTYLADVGGKKYIDNSLPAGATEVTYAIQGVRSTAVGMWGNFLVKFGTNAGGQQTASITQSAPKLAA